ncbi:MAG: phosphate signaling complex protein PhoU [Prevotellaceae bacterium]|jgi:phosphate transport system protein|nr:phosphate signaling complex protein PhoU [Prevotellaceae bacterium]
MKHKENELQALKEDVTQMWKLVLSQLEKAQQAFLYQDAKMAEEIVGREKRVDAFELKIDCDCENYIALYNPVAIDLRLVLSLIKISNTLERIGDFCEGIAYHVFDKDCPTLERKIVEELQIESLFDILVSMLADSFVALVSENTDTSEKILSKERDVDAIYRNAIDVLDNYLHQNPAAIRCGLKTVLFIRKLKRIGDHCANLVEEIVFYIDAKVLKHGNI